MTIKKIIILIGCLVAGALFFFFQQDLLIVHFGWLNTNQTIKSEKIGQFCKRQVSIIFWKDTTWRSQSESILWKDSDLAESLKHLINAWIMHIQEEKLIDYAVCLRHVALSTTNQVIISFNRSLLQDEWSIRQKMYFMEGLLKTIGKAVSSIQEVLFLVDEHYLEDDRLDFSVPWRVDGFLEEINSLNP